MSAPAAATVDDYIDAQPAERRDDLHALRRVILAAVPDAAEAIRYGMPAYRFPNGHPVYFAGWKHHVSIHDVPVLSPDLEAELAPFRSGKDTLKFPATAVIPLDLIRRVMETIAASPRSSGPAS